MGAFVRLSLTCVSPYSFLLYGSGSILYLACIFLFFSLFFRTLFVVLCLMCFFMKQDCVRKYAPKYTGTSVRTWYKIYM